jgi:hypothetical protein
MYASLHNRKIVFSFLPSKVVLHLDGGCRSFMFCKCPYTSPDQELSLSKFTFIFKPAPRCLLIIEYITVYPVKQTMSNGISCLWPPSPVDGASTGGGSTRPTTLKGRGVG